MLSDNVKVGVWPINMNLAKFLVDNDNDLVEAKKQMILVLEQVRVKAASSIEALEEVTKRKELVEQF